MASPFMFDSDDPVSMYRAAMLGRAAGGSMRRFDEYYRCYPVAMMPGPDRKSANHGGKVFMPASALEKLTRLQIVYPMLFELINGAKETATHAGVLEFTAEEGKIYLPFWLMQTLVLEAGDLVQIKSTDLPPGSLIKLQPQSPAFLDITDPKAVLENAFRSFSCLTVGDIFSFEYNDNVYEIAVLQVKPETEAQAICTLETDLSVDFAEPVGYQEQLKAQEASKATSKGLPAGGKIHTQGTMAQAINYDAIKPKSGTLATGAQQIASNFGGEGSRLGNRKSSKNATPGTSTPLLADEARTAMLRKGNGPQPLRLPPNKLFFGYEYIPPKSQATADPAKKTHFSGRGQNLRGKVVDSSDMDVDSADDKDPATTAGRTLRDTKKP